MERPPCKSSTKECKNVFFEENAKDSSPKWGDQDDEEDMQNAPLWNYNATTEENASSSAAASAEKSKKGSPAGKDEIDPNFAESLMQIEADLSDATPKSAEKFKVFLKDKLRERQHTLVPSAPNSPSRENPPSASREIVEDE
jgi:hypothetical protein